MLRSLFLPAACAGAFAALILTLVQVVWITPLILQAETYESSAPEQAHASHEHAHDHDHDHGHDPSHDDDHAHAGSAGHQHGEWTPADGGERLLYTLAANVVMGVAYALLLLATYSLWRRPDNIAEGLLFGLAGFAAFFAAPGLGLPPSLPGTALADLFARQQWWLSAALATAVGLALLFAQKNPALRLLGVIVAIVPHLLGAPRPAAAGSVAPADLQTQFRLATTVGNALFWLALGAASAFALRKFSDAQHGAA